jgi:hypothetical protein
MEPGQGEGYWRLRSKKLLDYERARESEPEVHGMGKSRPAASAPAKPRATVYWLPVLLPVLLPALLPVLWAIS